MDGATNEVPGDVTHDLKIEVTDDFTDDPTNDLARARHISDLIVNCCPMNSARNFMNELACIVAFRNELLTHYSNPDITGSCAELYIEPGKTCIGDVDLMFPMTDHMVVCDGSVVDSIDVDEMIIKSKHQIVRMDSFEIVLQTSIQLGDRTVWILCFQRHKIVFEDIAWRKYAPWSSQSWWKWVSWIVERWCRAIYTFSRLAFSGAIMDTTRQTIFMAFKCDRIQGTTERMRCCLCVSPGLQTRHKTMEIFILQSWSYFDQKLDSDSTASISHAQIFHKTKYHPLETSKKRCLTVGRRSRDLRLLSRDRSATFFKKFSNCLKRLKNVVWQSAAGRVTSDHSRTASHTASQMYISLILHLLCCVFANNIISSYFNHLIPSLISSPCLIWYDQMRQGWTTLKLYTNHDEHGHDDNNDDSQSSNRWKLHINIKWCFEKWRYVTCRTQPDRMECQYYSYLHILPWSTPTHCLLSNGKYREPSMLFHKRRVDTRLAVVSETRQVDEDFTKWERQHNLFSRKLREECLSCQSLNFLNSGNLGPRYTERICLIVTRNTISWMGLLFGLRELM